MIAWLKQPHSKLSFRKPFLKTHTIKTSEIPSAGSPKNYKRAITLPTNSHPFLLNTCLRSKLCPKTSSLHTPPNPALTQPTSPLNKNPSFAKGNFICPMCASPNIKPLIRHCCHVFHGLWYYVPPTLVLRYKHWCTWTWQPCWQPYWQLYWTLKIFLDLLSWYWKTKLFWQNINWLVYWIVAVCHSLVLIRWLIFC